MCQKEKFSNFVLATAYSVFFLWPSLMAWGLFGCKNQKAIWISLLEKGICHTVGALPLRPSCDSSSVTWGPESLQVETHRFSLRSLPLVACRIQTVKHCPLETAWLLCLWFARVPIWPTSTLHHGSEQISSSLSSKCLCIERMLLSALLVGCGWGRKIGIGEGWWGILACLVVFGTLAFQTATPRSLRRGRPVGQEKVNAGTFAVL